MRALLFLCALIGVLLAITLGVAAGLLPAAQAMRLQVAEALRRK